MRTSDFDYPLPHELIAQYPNQKRDHSRLLHLDRRSGAVSDRFFQSLPTLLRKNDRVVFNDSRVFPARLFCRKCTTGASIELLFLQQSKKDEWRCLARPARRLKTGTLLMPADNDEIHLSIRAIDSGGHVTVHLQQSLPEYDSMLDILHTYGRIPLPPYIQREDSAEDKDRYQTVYARHVGSVAAPTAGLHFTPELLRELTRKGVGLSYITLHVGLGTFRPVETDDPQKHPMHEERYSLTRETVDQINETKASGGRIVAVGTTVVRVLEHCAAAQGKVTESEGSTTLKILPGYEFKTIDAMITNFHLPKSTLLMLVSAFASRQYILDAYRHAVTQSYRFFSYGDAMFIS